MVRGHLGVLSQTASSYPPCRDCSQVSLTICRRPLLSHTCPPNASDLFWGSLRFSEARASCITDVPENVSTPSVPFGFAWRWNLDESMSDIKIHPAGTRRGGWGGSSKQQSYRILTWGEEDQPVDPNTHRTPFMVLPLTPARFPARLPAQLPSRHRG